jgi:peroxiredoxin/putative methionine-R-sulfoxide reductase with GAF domain
MSEVEVRKGARLAEELRAIVADEGDRVARARRVAEAIRRHGAYRWVGLYDVGASEVAIVAWSGPGPPAYPRFPVTQGLTATALATAQPVVVDDVTGDPRYLDAFGDTRSEMIVPVLVGSGDAVRGTIDAESEQPQAFGDADRALLTAAAAAAAPLWSEAGNEEPGDVYSLPSDLPMPIDDGASDHLVGTEVPRLTLDSSQGPVDLAELAAERAVHYIYPRTGKPGQPAPPGWDDVPGARGCTPESCGFRDHAAELAALGSRVAGLSAQTLDDQIEFATRNRMPFPVIADPERKLGAALRLPTFDFDGATLYIRITLVAERGSIVKVFYPVFPPDRAAEEVLTWLRAQGEGASRLGN